MSPLHHKARAWNSRAWWAAPAIGLSLLGCGKPKVVAVAKPKAHVRVQAFTEAQPVRAIAATPSYLFATNGAGLDRWNLQSGERLPLTHEHGLPGTDVYAMAYDKARDWLWVATDAGISSYAVGTSTFSELPQPPDILGIKDLTSAVLAPALDGGVWVGVTEGLFYLQSGSGWGKTGVETAVHALYQDELGALWIGGDGGLMRVDQDGVARSMAAAQSCEFASVSSVARFDEEHVVVLAQSGAGQQILALAGKEGCATFEDREGTGATDERWIGAASDGAAVTYLLSEKGVFQLRLQAVENTAPLATAKLRRLKVVAKASKMSFSGGLELEELNSQMPPDVRSVSTNQSRLFLAAGRLGTMAWNAAQGDRPGQWFRRSELSAGADVLSVACQSRDRCFLSTASQTAANALWTWDGKAFSKEEGGPRVHGVLALDDGRILSLVEHEGGLMDDAAAARGDGGTTGAGGAAMAVRVLEDGVWNEISGLRIETPGEHVRIKALRQAPDGQIWVSLDYLDKSGESTPYGLAVLDLNLGYVVYHRASFDEQSTKKGILPVPVDVTGIAFVGEDEVWLASSQGATRVVGQDIKTYIEADGLRSELLDGVVCSSGGMVYTASSRGVGEWNGERWSFPPAMRTSINDLAIGAGGQLWLATDKGMGVYNGDKVRRLDTRRGLVENQIKDIESDKFGRIWALSAQGLVLISP